VHPVTAMQVVERDGELFYGGEIEAGGLEGALAYLARLDCDYWETGRCRTAGFTGNPEVAEQGWELMNLAIRTQGPVTGEAQH
jgi:hypothetical protein